jgi:hypothetical protein
MSKTTIKGIVQIIFDKKRQNQLYEHQFIRVAENGTSSIFDVQFYNAKIKTIEASGVKEGDEVLIEGSVVGKLWDKDGKSGNYIKINGQNITKCN